MSVITKSIEKFHTEYSDTDSRNLLSAIFKHPNSSVIDSYLDFYNNPDNKKEDWHFWWIFSKFLLQSQLELIEKAVETLSESRTAFDNHLFSESRLFDLLNISESPEHKTLFQIIGYGWSYYINVCDPSEKSRIDSISELIKEIKSFVS